MNVCKFCGIDQADILLHESQCQKRPANGSSGVRTSKNRTLTPEQIRGYDSYSRNELIADVLDLRATLRNADAQIKALTAIADGQQGYKDRIERLTRERDEAREHTSTAAFMRLEAERDEWARKWHRVRAELAELKYPGMKGIVRPLSDEPNSAPETAAKSVIAEMISAAAREDDGAVDWPIDCRDQVDRWQSKLQDTLGLTGTIDSAPKASETKARLIVDLDAEQGFEAGWRAATAWTDRDDLLSDIGSSAYHAAMTEEFERMLARKPERHALKAPETAASLQAPAVRVVIENGKVAYTTIYDPGLPDGTHDLYCEPEAVAPMMRDETAAKSRNAHISNLTVRLLDAAYVVTWQEDGEPCGSETISEKLAYALVRADGGILGITDDSAVKAPAHRAEDAAEQSERDMLARGRQASGEPT